MMRQAFEKGLASVVARWMLDGSAEAVIARVAKSGVLKPEEVDALRHDTTEHLQKVRDEGAAYADVVSTALREVAAHLPLSGLASVAVTAAGAIPWKDTVGLASRIAMDLATKSAEAAAIHAQTLHENLEAQRRKQTQAREQANAEAAAGAGSGTGTGTGTGTAADTTAAAAEASAAPAATADAGAAEPPSGSQAEPQA